MGVSCRAARSNLGSTLGIAMAVLGSALMPPLADARIREWVTHPSLDDVQNLYGVRRPLARGEVSVKGRGPRHCLDPLTRRSDRGAPSLNRRAALTER